MGRNQHALFDKVTVGRVLANLEDDAGVVVITPESACGVDDEPAVPAHLDPIGVGGHGVVPASLPGQAAIGNESTFVLDALDSALRRGDPTAALEKSWDHRQYTGLKSLVASPVG